MGFFEDMGDLLDPFGITDFDNNGSHDMVESLMAMGIAQEIIDDSINYDENEKDTDAGYEEDDFFDEEDDDEDF